MRQTQQDKKEAGLDPETQTQRKRFLEAIAGGSTVCEAVKSAGIGRATVDRWRDEDPVFSQSWYDAWEDYVDSLEAMARRRVTSPSNTMLLRLLSAYRPEVFGDGKPRNGKQSMPVPEETPEQIRERVNRDLARKRAELEARAESGDLIAQIELSEGAVNGLGTGTRDGRA